MSLVLLNELPNCERIKNQGASDGDTLFRGFKQTGYFDTGRLQGYPLCEIFFFHFLIGFSIRDWSIEMWEGLPPKIGYPKKMI